MIGYICMFGRSDTTINWVFISFGLRPVRFWMYRFQLKASDMRLRKCAQNNSQEKWRREIGTFENRCIK